MIKPVVPYNAIRDHMHQWMERSLSINLYLRQCQSPLLDTWARISAILVSESSIAFLIISNIWLLESTFARHFAFCVCVCFVIVCFIKDLLCLPRPPLSLVDDHHGVNETDWGFPSLHTAAGFTNALFAWIYFYYYGHLSGVALWTLSAVVLLWCISTSVSRIYLGVHSAFDVLGGAVIGVLVVALYAAYMEIIDEWFFGKSFQGPLCVFILAFLIIWKHPITEPLTPTYATSTMLISVGTGTVFAYFLNNALGYTPQTFLERRGVLPFAEGDDVVPFHTVGKEFVVNSLLRWIVGFPIAISVRFLIKYISGFLFTRTCKYFDIAYEHHLEKRLERQRSFTHLHHVSNMTQQIKEVDDNTNSNNDNDNNNNNNNNKNNNDNNNEQNNDQKDHKKTNNKTDEMELYSDVIFKRCGLDSEYFVKCVTYNLFVMSVISLVPHVYDLMGI